MDETGRFGLGLRATGGNEFLAYILGNKGGCRYFGLAAFFFLASSRPRISACADISSISDGVGERACRSITRTIAASECRSIASSGLTEGCGKVGPGTIKDGAVVGMPWRGVPLDFDAGGALDKACCVFSANMRRASLDAICEPSKIAAFDQSPDFRNEASDGKSSPSVGTAAFGGSAERVGNGTTAAREHLEDLERLAIGVRQFLVDRGGKFLPEASIFV